MGEGNSLTREEKDGGVGGSSNANKDTTNSNGSVLPPLRPIHYHAIIFLALATFLQIISSVQNKAGPIDWLAGIVIPHFASWGFLPGTANDGIGFGGDSAMDGDSQDGELTCPGGEWVDAVFGSHPPLVKDDVHGSGALYSANNDPRNKIIYPTFFPHCALRRWVKVGKKVKGGMKHPCPEGHQYATVFLPAKQNTNTQQSQFMKGKGIPKIVHISSPTNCLPTSTITTLRGLAGSGEHTFYIHSPETMDALLFEREWDAFPEAKEGVLCGTKKLEMATLAAMAELKVGVNGNSTSARERYAEEIALGARRDIWRLLVLWEYGGITLGMDALNTILTEGGDASSSVSSETSGASNNTTITSQPATTEKGIQTMLALMTQWSTETSTAILYFINNEDKQRLPYNQRIPLTDIMGAAPRHPLLFYAAKDVFRKTNWDSEKSITDTGRSTKIHSITEALTKLQRNWWTAVKTGQDMKITKFGDDDDTNSIHFLDGDTILPPQLSSPRTTPWMTIFSAFKLATASSTEGPTEERINEVMRHFAAEQQYIPKKMFSCMELTLDMYLGKKTEVKTKSKEQ